MPDDEDVEHFEARRDAADLAVLQSHVARLCERFDAVQLIATRYCPQTGTSLHTAGGGNHYARVAAAESWLKQAKK